MLGLDWVEFGLYTIKSDANNYQKIFSTVHLGEKHPGRDHREERHLRLHGRRHSYEPHHRILHHHEPWYNALD